MVNFKVLPLEFMYESRAMALTLDLDRQTEKYTLLINGVYFNDLPEAPTRRELLARSKTS